MTESSPIEGIRSLLVEDGLINPRTAKLEVLSGGVSCDVVKVVDGANSFVVKRALPKLRVDADWFADVGRNKFEHRYLSIVDGLIRGAVPKVLYSNDEKKFFCMEYLQGEWVNWKADLLNGVCRIEAAAEAGRTLGLIHCLTAGDRELAAEFSTDQGFFDLRLEPYLVTTGKKHDNLRSLFEEEVERIASTRQCLVHGDYSPKNILVDGDQIKILDCEVAWYGDPSFDLAFLLNHLLLKSLHHTPASLPFDEMFDAAMSSYFAAPDLDTDASQELNTQTARLLLMLLLARVDGKSPVEYLADKPLKQDFIRTFVTTHLVENNHTLQRVAHEWFAELRKKFDED